MVQFPRGALGMRFLRLHTSADVSVALGMVRLQPCSVLEAGVLLMQLRLDCRLGKLMECTNPPGLSAAGTLEDGGVWGQGGCRLCDCDVSIRGHNCTPFFLK